MHMHVGSDIPSTVTVPVPLPGILAVMDSNPGPGLTVASQV